MYTDFIIILHYNYIKMYIKNLKEAMKSNELQIYV